MAAAPAPAPPSRLRTAIPLLLTAVGFVALGALLRNLHRDDVNRLFAAGSLLAVAILVPNTVTFLLDTVAWSSCFPAGARPSFARVLLIRTGGEALTSSLPGGVVVGEVWKLEALARIAPQTPRDVAIGTLGLAKLALASSQIVFVLLGLALGSRRLLQGSGSLLAVLLTFAIFLAFFFVPVGLVRRFYRRHQDKPPPAPEGSSAYVATKAKLASVVYVLADEVARAFRERRGEVQAAFLLSFTGWLVGSLETYVGLRALSIPIGIDEAVAIESLGTIFRMVFFLAPGGLGAQDWGLTALLTLFGVQDPVVAGARFALVKRAREVVWIAVGLVIVAALAVTRRRQEEPRATSQLRGNVE